MIIVMKKNQMIKKDVQKHHPQKKSDQNTILIENSLSLFLLEIFKKAPDCFPKTMLSFQLRKIIIS